VEEVWWWWWWWTDGLERHERQGKVRLRVGVVGAPVPGSGVDG